MVEPTCYNGCPATFINNELVYTCGYPHCQSEPEDTPEKEEETSAAGTETKK